MTKIRVTCWFENSEEFVAKLVIANGYKCYINKIIDPMAIITGRSGYFGEKYDFFGKIEEINKLTDYLENSDFDVDVVRLERKCPE